MAKRFLMALGVILFLLGIIGAFTGGHDHEVLGLGVNGSHNMVHIVTGLIAIAMAWAGESATRLGCQLFAIVYGAIMVAGFAGAASLIDALNINMGDNLLHLAITVACAWCGFRPPQRPPTPPVSARIRRPEREPVGLGRH